ncbi:MAG: hypothetical protein A2Z91_01495 [Deltaproteobacteria bacterium GWA2_38_16]|nr:MAG: hypothetical protein A2Z91_01495 [Deltaproteobacteria bacterium GWA2_38_16]OGQ03313.1 MAG: hypothetical protein A3D19_00190 [Deltaproteobacteria bacterium RIFCSPHIGHO2_02_FULL_38_15]OGQ30476.1 MAG: hypothetical protein A3A72_08795 [Deltaproteobacteria bacterium RIFCSPLOWO2_01_FULL_38_9]OGQ63185.1 MAG: hypothetical protein A3G92_03820 [Deltaproteobacteria bacterium RIFCSPLOWO2_12_FULL_38_8]HBQ22016.1 hypothetical protein [Deltaproteobacteria bacterium]
MNNCIIFFFFIFFLVSQVGFSQEKIPPLKKRPLPPRHNQCHLCHLKKDKYFISKAKPTRREHTDRHLQHGKLNISCHHCHDINNSNYLRSFSPEEPASFENPSPVCIRCHRERYRDWKKGMHGKRIGGWDPKLQEWYSCIDCHDPHSVKFKPMKAVPPPKRPRFGRSH